MHVHVFVCVRVNILHLEGFGVVEIEVGGAIAQDERLAISRRAPALQYTYVCVCARARVCVCVCVCSVCACVCMDIILHIHIRI